MHNLIWLVLCFEAGSLVAQASLKLVVDGLELLTPTTTQSTEIIGMSHHHRQIMQLWRLNLGLYI